MIRIALMLTAVAFVLRPSISSAAEPTRYLRFQKGDTIAYGTVEDDRVRQLDGDLFGQWSETDTTYALDEVDVLIPSEPKQVLALAGNYRSHLGADEIPPKLQIPQPFYKSVSSLVATGEPIVVPEDAQEVHYEAEMVIVIGQTCRDVSKDEALDYVLGVTAGNDVSERIWQNDEEVKDVQWWRAKGADTFGPVGPYILSSDTDYGNLMLRLRLNGDVKQEEKTDHLIHDVPSVVSFISQYVTLHPGDLIFTGTPGTTSTIQPGDVVEVELEGAGVLRDPVKAEQ